MRNVVLARVDDRLIHGEVVTSWIPFFKADHVVIVDDEVAGNRFNRRVLMALAPAGTTMEIYTVEEAVPALNADGDAKETVIVLTKSPLTFEKLILDNGVDIKKVNIGGMGIRGERKPFVKNCSATPEEVEAVKKMRDAGVDVYYQLVAEQGVIALDNAIANYK